MRFGWSGAAFGLALLGSGPALAQAQVQSGQYGGGFIEFLMTGSAPGQPRHPAVDGYGGLAPRPVPQAAP
ncbi:MAG: L,D-transpeptidase, partial [Methylorubrum rhodinum]